MTELAIATPPSRPIAQPTKRLEVRGKLRQALMNMIWGVEPDTPLPWNEAAQAANFDVSAMRKALERPHVRQFLKHQRDVLRASICAANPVRLKRIADQTGNMNAAVTAIRQLEQMDEDQERAGSVQRAPGVTVIVVSQAPVRDISTTYADVHAVESRADEVER